VANIFGTISTKFYKHWPGFVDNVMTSRQIRNVTSVMTVRRVIAYRPLIPTSCTCREVLRRFGHNLRQSCNCNHPQCSKRASISAENCKIINRLSFNRWQYCSRIAARLWVSTSICNLISASLHHCIIAVSLGPIRHWV